MPRWSDLAFAVGGLALGGLLLLGSVTEDPPDTILWPWELGFGAASTLALVFFRRRWPVGSAICLSLVGPLSTISVAMAAVAILNAAILRPWHRMAPAAILFAVEIAVLFSLAEDLDYWSVVPPILFLEAALVASGMLVRSQRELVRSLREQAKLATEDARRLERERIAREMHDVLGHRISLLALQAGALEFSPNVSREEMARAVGTIRSSAYDAAEDLREVIQVLRTPSETSPQPTLTDLPALISEQHVTLETSLEDVPVGIGRHAYRIVQEGLTNARKHAPGQPVRVTVSGAPGTGLTVEIRNPLGTADLHAVGARVGLVGVAERVELAKGRLDHGPTPGGEFVLRAWLPWPP